MNILKQIKTPLKYRILLKLGVPSIAEEIRKVLYNISLDDYPLEDLCRESTLRLRFGFFPVVRTKKSMYNPYYVNSYFNKEYKTPSYILFASCYDASRYIIEDLIEKLYENIFNKQMTVRYEFQTGEYREYVLDLDTLRRTCYASLGAGFLADSIHENVKAFILQYTLLLIDDIREVGFEKFSIVPSKLI